MIAPKWLGLLGWTGVIIWGLFVLYKIIKICLDQDGQPDIDV